MKTEIFLQALNSNKIEWKKHTVQRMMQREITRKEVKKCLKYGEIIEKYENDKPYESALFSYISINPLHVVASFNQKDETIYIITTYRPSDEYFLSDMKTRRKDI